jgi:hypothetical protein
MAACPTTEAFEPIPVSLANVLRPADSPVLCAIVGEGGGMVPRAAEFNLNPTFAVSGTPGQQVLVHVEQFVPWGKRTSLKLFAFPSDVSPSDLSLPLAPEFLTKALAEASGAANPFDLSFKLPASGCAILVLGHTPGKETGVSLAVTSDAPVELFSNASLPSELPDAADANSWAHSVFFEESVRGLSAAGRGEHYAENRRFDFKVSALAFLAVSYKRTGGSSALPSGFHLFLAARVPAQLDSETLTVGKGCLLASASTTDATSRRVVLQPGCYTLVVSAEQEAHEFDFALTMRSNVAFDYCHPAQPETAAAATGSITSSFRHAGAWLSGLAGGQPGVEAHLESFARNPTYLLDTTAAIGPTSVHMRLQLPSLASEAERDETLGFKHHRTRISVCAYLVSVSGDHLGAANAGLAAPGIKWTVEDQSRSTSFETLVHRFTVPASGLYAIILSTIRPGVEWTYELSLKLQSSCPLLVHPVAPTIFPAFEPGQVATSENFASDPTHSVYFEGSWEQGRTADPGFRLSCDATAPVYVRVILRRGTEFNAVSVSVHSEGCLVARGPANAFPGISSTAFPVHPGAPLDVRFHAGESGSLARCGTFRAAFIVDSAALMSDVRHSRPVGLAVADIRSLEPPTLPSYLLQHPVVDTLLDGVKRLDIPLQYPALGPIAVFGDASFAVVTGAAGDYHRDVVSVRKQWCKRLRAEARSEVRPVDTAYPVLAGFSGPAPNPGPDRRGRARSSSGASLRLLVTGPGLLEVGTGAVDFGACRLLHQCASWLSEGEVAAFHCFGSVHAPAVAALTASGLAVKQHDDLFDVFTQDALRRTAAPAMVVLEPAAAVCSDILEALNERLAAGFATYLVASLGAWQASLMAAGRAACPAFAFPLNRLLLPLGLAFAPGAVAEPNPLDALCAEPTFDPSAAEDWWKFMLFRSPSTGLDVGLGSSNNPALGHAANAAREVNPQAELDPRTCTSLLSTALLAVLSLPPFLSEPLPLGVQGFDFFAERFRDPSICPTEESKVPLYDAFRRLAAAIEVAIHDAIDYAHELRDLFAADGVPVPESLAPFPQQHTALLPAAQYFPGLPDEDCPRVSDLAVELRVPEFVAPAPSEWVWSHCHLPTRLYLAAGETMTLTFPQWMVAVVADGAAPPASSCVHVRVGVHSDALMHRRDKEWPRFPDGLVRSHPVYLPSVTVSSPFGGPVEIALPTSPRADFLAGLAAAGSRIALTVTGGVKAPYWLFGETTQADWSAMLVPGSEFGGNLAVIETPNFVVHSPRSILPTDVDLSSVCTVFSDVTAKIRDLWAFSPLGWQAAEQLVFDPVPACGSAHSGYPMVASYEHLSFLQSPEEFCFTAIPHEIAHNCQSDIVRWEGIIEGSANISAAYVRDAVVGRDMWADSRAQHAADLACVTISDTIATPAYKLASFEADAYVISYGLLLMFVQDFGFPALRTALRTAPHAKADDNIARRALFARVFSDVAGKSVCDVMASLGAPVDEETARQVRHVHPTEWVPSRLTHVHA